MDKSGGILHVQERQVYSQDLDPTADKVFYVACAARGAVASEANNSLELLKFPDSPTYKRSPLIYT